MIKNGDIVVGFDFGRLRNHIVGTRIRIDHSHEDNFEILSWQMIDLEGSCMRVKLQSLFEMQSDLWPGEGKESPDWYIMESQVPRNPTCYALAAAFEMFLMGRGVPANRIFSASSLGKFKTLDPKNDFRPGNVGVEQRHALMKKWAVLLATEKMKNQTAAATDYFNSAPKKDDLADAFLYAVAFIEKHKRAFEYEENEE